jgi:hypothetical protein
MIDSFDLSVLSFIVFSPSLAYFDFFDFHLLEFRDEVSHPSNNFSMTAAGASLHVK